MRASTFVAGIVYDFRVTTLVMEEQVGKFAVGDLGKMNLSWPIAFAQRRDAAPYPSGV